MRLIFFMCLLALRIAVSDAQPLTQATKDSLIKITCEIARTDQLYKTKNYHDSVVKARKTGDQFLLTTLEQKAMMQDRNNFKQLQRIMQRYGYPSKNLLGTGYCPLDGVLINWSIKYPEWFNSPEIITLIKKELERGNVTLSAIDYAHYFYVRFGEREPQYKDIINNARLTYGLLPYTDSQYYTDVWIEPLNDK